MTKVLEVLGQSTGGVGRHVAEVVAALDRRDGLTLDIAAPGDLRAPMPKAVVPVPIPSGLRGHGRAVRVLVRVLRSGGYDLVHAHGLRAGLDGALAGRRASVPVVVTLHNLIVPEVAGGAGARLYRRLEPLVVRLSARTFVPSRAMAERLAGDAPSLASRIEVVYAGAAEAPAPRRSRDAVREELGADEGRLVVTVARLHPQKALDVMIRAVARLDDVVLAIAGGGPLEGELRALALRLGIDRRVRFLGHRDDAADLIAAADVFCLSSAWEAVPLAAQEAVQLGVPVVATDVGGLRELIADRISGRLVPKGDDAALSRALDETLGAPEDRARYAAAAREWFERTFGRERVLDRLRGAYAEHARR